MKAMKPGDCQEANMHDGNNVCSSASPALDTLISGSEVHSRMLRGIMKDTGDGDGDGGGAGEGVGEGDEVLVPLRSAYASALAENRISGGGDEGKGGGGSVAAVAATVASGGGVATVDASNAATVAIGPHGEPAHTNVTPG